MGDENPIRTLGDYSKPSHEGYRNTIELPVGNNVVPLRSDTIRLVQNGCSFHGLRSEDPNQHLKDFLKLVDSLDLDGSITTWEDLTTRFLAQFFPPGRTAKLRNDILIRTIDQSVGGKLRDLSAEESWALLEDLALYDNESWNDPRDFAKPVKAIALPQDVPSTSDRRLIELENQVQRLMEAHLALTQPTQVNKITTSCEICSAPHDTQYCMEDPEQAFVEYAFSRTDEAGGEMTNKIDTVLKAITDQIAGTLPSDTIKNPKLGTHPVLSSRSYPTKDPQSSTHIHSSINAITIHPKQPEESQVNEPDVGSLGNISSNPHPQPDPLASIATEQVRKLNSMLESLGLVPQSSNKKFVCTKEEDGEVMFIEIIRDDDEPQNESPSEGERTTMEGPTKEYFDTFPTRDELTYHKYPMCGPIPLIFLLNPIITEGCSSNLKIPCNIGHVHVEKAYIDLNSPLNIMTRMMYNWIMRRKLDPRENANGGISNFTGRIKGMHVFIGNFTYVVDFMIVEDISSIIDPRLSQVVLGRPFIEISNMTHDLPEGVVRFANGDDEVAYKMPHKIEQYNSLSNLEKEHTKSVYLRNEEDKKRGVDYVMSKILGFYKACLELGPEYVTGLDDE
ncbi:MAK10-like protein [Tanacetum coccineum]|uniref:MAK10-like protein n=1 Tax=Tanacetum coccineum TaxID=301880 RepID=A0ABQ4XNX1_9ASTR